MAIPNPNIPLPANLDMTVTAYNIPLSAIALWPPPNYTNPEQRFGLAPFAFFLEILTTLVLAGRIWARLTRRAGTFGADDVLVILAWMFGTAFTALSISGVIDGGFDRHVWDVPQTLVAQGGFVAWASEGFFLASSCLTKVSILLFYRRLVNRSYSKRIQNVIYGLIAFTAVYFVVFVFFLIFVCDPVSASWQSLNLGYAVPYKCSSRRFMDTLAGAVSVISDAYVLIIPELVVYRLKMERKKKIVLFALFGSGAIVVGAGMARTVWLSRLHTDSRRDLTWIGYELLLWTIIEMQGSIICASAPAIKALISAYFSETKGTTSLGSLVGQKGTLVSTVNMDSRDWPISNDMANDMEKPRVVIEEKPPPPPPKDNYKGWEDGPYGGITVTERYSVVSTINVFADARRDGSRKGRKVLGF